MAELLCKARPLGGGCNGRFLSTGLRLWLRSLVIGQCHWSLVKLYCLFLEYVDEPPALIIVVLIIGDLLPHDVLETKVVL